MQSNWNLTPWFERVSSEANGSDEISRDCLDLANEFGWIQLDLNLDEVYKILASAANDLLYAHTDALGHIEAALDRLSYNAVVNNALQKATCGDT
jgi:hypothetical protein